MDAAEFIKRIGHDGSAVIDEALEAPEKYLGFHAQECLDVVWAQGYSVTQIEKEPLHLKHDSRIVAAPIEEPVKRLHNYLYTHKGTFGVLYCYGKSTQHALTYYSRDYNMQIIDPDDASQLSLDQLSGRGLDLRIIWRLDERKHR